jgi:hypothetical protein
MFLRVCCESAAHFFFKCVGFLFSVSSVHSVLKSTFHFTAHFSPPSAFLRKKKCPVRKTGHENCLF